MENNQIIPLDIMNSRGQLAFAAGTRREQGEATYLVKKIIYDGVQTGASDVFIAPKPNGSFQVRYRVDGTLKDIMTIDATLGMSVASAIKAAASMDITEKRRPQDGAFSAVYPGGQASFRVASVGALGGEKITIRIIGSESGPRDLAGSGIVGENLKIIKHGVALPSGLILVCGPTGSGKTTTLYGMLGEIDYKLRNVISIEDPIERIIPSISQMEVNSKADITFASLLRNALRQNPDIICLGEIRDEETAEVASHAAQTGHLIIATTHSNDNFGTIDRLISLGVQPRTIASILHIVISQRLVRKLCKCAVHGKLPEDIQEYFARNKMRIDKVKIPCGCRDCEGTGYLGRIAVFDILKMTSEIRATLEDESATLTSIKESLEKLSGGNAMIHDGLKLVESGVTSVDEIRRIAVS